MRSDCWQNNTAPAVANFLQVSAVALVDNNNHILLSRRPAGKKFADLWEFPGGKRQAGETPEQTAVRELREELAVETVPSCLAPLGFSSWTDEDGHLLLLLFVCRQWRKQNSEGGGEFTVGREGQALKWVSVLSLNDYPQPPANAHLCALLRDLL